MRETIQRVMAAEDEATRLVEAAREEGVAILAEGRKRAQELTDRIRQEARLAGEAILRTATEEAHRDREERLRRASAELETSVRLEEATARQAIDAIVRCVCRP